jgi:hypothetical protein
VGRTFLDTITIGLELMPLIIPAWHTFMRMQPEQRIVPEPAFSEQCSRSQTGCRIQW